MSKYRRGYRLELRAQDELQAQGWIVIRSAGSKGPADLVALREGSRSQLIQVKSDGYLPPKERQELLDEAEKAGADACVVGRLKRSLMWKRLNPALP